MDELELLKKDWKKNDTQFKQVSENEIYGMLHKSSSSIVKWIFIISIVEFLVLRLMDLSLFFDENLKNKLKQIHIYDIEKTATIINMVVLLGFIFYFYKNLKNISATSSVSNLMKDIIKTRRIVKYYVWYNLGMLVFSLIVGFIIAFAYNPEMDAFKQQINSSAKIMAITIGVLSIFSIALFGLLWLFYRVLYGTLLRRLYANYKELKKIDL